MELLVVIAIITLLIAFLLPALGKARFNAMLTICASRMKQCYIGIQMYAQDSNYAYPLSDQSGSFPTLPADYSPGAYGWYGVPFLLNGGYISDYHALFCPGITALPGWPAPGFGPYTQYYAFCYCNLRTVDLPTVAPGGPWAADMRYSNWAWGTVLLSCVVPPYEADPRDWRHLNFTDEMRNDGSYRLRNVPIIGLDVIAVGNCQVVFDPSVNYQYNDAWWLGQE